MARMKRCFVDAGHGGSKPGAVDGRSGSDKVYSIEKHLNLDVARRVQKHLKGLVYVNQSRTSDIDVSLKARVNEAIAWKADIFISIHHNAGPSSAKGAETLYRTSEGKVLAKLVQKHIEPVTPYGDRGIKYRDNLYVLNARRSYVLPRCLVEPGFQTNETEEKLLAQPEYRDRIALAIANGALEYLKINRLPTEYPRWDLDVQNLRAYQVQHVEEYLKKQNDPLVSVKRDWDGYQ